MQEIEYTKEEMDIRLNSFTKSLENLAQREIVDGALIEITIHNPKEGKVEKLGMSYNYKEIKNG